MLTPSQRKQMAKWAVKDKTIVIQRACRLFQVSETCYRYQPRLSALIADWLLRLAYTNWKWGFGLCFLYLRDVQGLPYNYRRVYRTYRELELNLRIKPKRRMKRDRPDSLEVPRQINVTWSIDFMHDRLDDYNREGLGIEVDLSLPAPKVIRALGQIIEWRGKLQVIRSGNGPEYVSAEFQCWADKNDIDLLFIQTGKPAQNAYVERFNRTVRTEWLEEHIFESVEHAQATATARIWRYNTRRPHMALGGITPKQKSAQAA